MTRSDDSAPARGCLLGMTLGLVLWLGIVLLCVGCFHPEETRREACYYEPVPGMWAVCRDVGAPAVDPRTLSEQRDSIVAEEARKIGVPVNLAIAVSHIENWSGDSMAVSSKGAVGLMQVMPEIWQHEFEEDCGCGSVFPRRRNACLGVHVMQYYRARQPTWERALRAYHGSYDHPQGRDYISALVEALAAMGAHVEPKDSAPTVSIPHTLRRGM